MSYPNETTIIARWASSSAASYRVSVTDGGVTITFTTSDTEYNIHRVDEDAPYSISVVPMNQFCQGSKAGISASRRTGNITI